MRECSEERTVRPTSALAPSALENHETGQAESPSSQEITAVIRLLSGEDLSALSQEYSVGTEILEDWARGFRLPGTVESQFNVVIPSNEADQSLLYNTLTGALVCISSNELRVVRWAMRDPDTLGSERSDEVRLLCQLIKLGFLVNPERDELKALLYSHDVLRHSPGSFAMTISPTLRCNFRCDYCFSPHQDIDMSPEVVAAIKRIGQAITAPRLFVTWFGGEPLLRVDIVRELSSFFASLDLEYSSQLITNGYLLDRETVEQLRETGLSGIQVTVDGPEPIHNRHRSLSDGTPTFVRVLENALGASELVPMTLRMNVGPAHLGHAENVAQLLVDISNRTDGKVAVHLMPILPLADSSDAEVMTWCSFSEFVEDVYTCVMQLCPSYRLPKLRRSPSVCCASTRDRLNIGPDGTLYRCWEEVGAQSEQSSGDVFRRMFSEREMAHQIKYLAWEGYKDQKCLACPFLPLCMGGCARMSYTAQRRPKEQECCQRWSSYVPTIVRLMDAQHRFLSGT